MEHFLGEEAFWDMIAWRRMAQHGSFAAIFQNRFHLVSLSGAELSKVW